MSPRTPVAQGKVQLNGRTDNLHLMRCCMTCKHRLEDRAKILIGKITYKRANSPEISEGANHWRALLNVTNEGGI